MCIYIIYTYVYIMYIYYILYNMLYIYAPSYNIYQKPLNKKNKSPHSYECDYSSHSGLE